MLLCHHHDNRGGSIHEYQTTQCSPFGDLQWYVAMVIFNSCISQTTYTSATYWGKPERAPHWLKSVMVSYGL